jgi:hypothetical protein
MKEVRKLGGMAQWLRGIGQQRHDFRTIIAHTVKDVEEAANIPAPPFPVNPDARFKVLREGLLSIHEMFKEEANDIFEITRNDASPISLPQHLRILGSLGGLTSGIISASTGLSPEKQRFIKLQAVTLFNMIVAFSEFTEGLLVGMISGEELKKRIARPPALLPHSKHINPIMARVLGVKTILKCDSEK